VERLREKYKNWNPIVKALTELTPYTRLYPNYAGEALPTWVLAARATLVGDAAHTHGGAFAAGGSLALDDSFALALAFRHALSLAKPGDFNIGPSYIRRALELYDQTRRPHTGKLLEIVHGQINKKPEAHQSIEEEDSALIAKMRNRPDTEWLSEHDVVEAFQQVLEKQQPRFSHITGNERTVLQESKL
jgi:salicylate hydroxylase